MVAATDLRDPGCDAVLETRQRSGVAGLDVEADPFVARFESA
jgi:hypothetical protein